MEDVLEDHEKEHFQTFYKQRAEKLSCPVNDEVCKFCPKDCFLEYHEGQAWGSRCGFLQGTQPSDEAERRKFCDDDAQTKAAKQRAEEYSDEMRRTICRIEPSTIDAASADEAAASLEARRRAKVLRRCNLRLNQALALLACLSDDVAPEGVLRLKPHELQTARLLLRAACIEWGREGATCSHHASPVFWVATIAREMAARRECGFCVADERQRRAFSLDGVHAWLATFQGDATTTDESDRAKTNVCAGLIAAQRCAERIKIRHFRIDPLGPARKRREKTYILHNLISKSKFWPKINQDDTTHPGLTRAVLRRRAPCVWQAPVPMRRCLPEWPAAKKRMHPVSHHAQSSPSMASTRSANAAS
jgi:hypothetical protein